MNIFVISKPDLQYSIARGSRLLLKIQNCIEKFQTTSKSWTFMREKKSATHVPPCIWTPLSQTQIILIPGNHPANNSEHKSSSTQKKLSRANDGRNKNFFLSRNSHCVLNGFTAYIHKVIAVDCLSLTTINFSCFAENNEIIIL